MKNVQPFMPTGTAKNIIGQLVLSIIVAFVAIAAIQFFATPQMKTCLPIPHGWSTLQESTSVAFNGNTHTVQYKEGILTHLVNGERQQAFPLNKYSTVQIAMFNVTDTGCEVIYIERRSK